MRPALPHPWTSTALTLLSTALACAALACDPPPAPAPDATPASSLPASLPSAPASVASSAPSVPASQASAPATGPSIPPPIEVQPGNLDVSMMLAVADVQGATNTSGALTPTRLEGIAPSTTYNAIRLQPTDRARGTYGAALQLWLTPGPAADERFELHLRTYPGAKATNDLGKRALSARRDAILHRSWIGADGSWVATLTCEALLCDDRSLLHLAQLVDKRITEAVPPPP